jgi:23S rRNA pseudouridine2605 synthase
VFDALGLEGDGLVAVGRLDLASSGLLLLTNDSQIANWLTDPANEVIRCYVVTVRGEVSDDQALSLTQRTDLRASSVTIHKRSHRETHLIVDLTEGKNREVRRLFGAIGHEVTRLLRVSFGSIELGALQPGRWREASTDELRAVQSAMAGG